MQGLVRDIIMLDVCFMFLNFFQIPRWAQWKSSLGSALAETWLSIVLLLIPHMVFDK